MSQLSDLFTKSLLLLPVRLPSLVDHFLVTAKWGILSSINLPSHIFHPIYQTPQGGRSDHPFMFSSSLGQGGSFLTVGHTHQAHHVSHRPPVSLMAGYSALTVYFHPSSPIPVAVIHPPPFRYLPPSLLVSLGPIATHHHFIRVARSVIDSPSWVRIDTSLTPPLWFRVIVFPLGTLVRPRRRTRDRARSRLVA